MDIQIACGFMLAALLAAGGDHEPARADRSDEMQRAAPEFHMVAVGGERGFAELSMHIGDAGLQTILRLNRVDQERAAMLDSLVLPVDPANGPTWSPFPARIPVLDRVPKLVVIALRIQAFAAYDSGRLYRWGPVCSGGRATPTRPGTFRVNWKRPHHTSTVDSTWTLRWAINIDNEEGTALHQYSMPGRPESHCCIRLLEADARALYVWVDPWTISADGRTVVSPGTPVAIVGAYDFDAPPPWRRLPVDPRADQFGEDELNELAGVAP